MMITNEPFDLSTHYVVQQ